jgi:tripartite-type tricarboxylate transporter receptor subunit TctC
MNIDTRPRPIGASDSNGQAARRTGRRKAVQALGAIGSAAVLGASHAQPASAWPTKPVRIIVTSAAGGPWDPMARHLAERLAKAFGQPFIVENKSGATGLIGMDLVAKTTDGHTLGVMFMPHTLMPSLFDKMPYDTLTDLVPVSQTQWTYNVLVVRPGLEASNIADLVKLARSRPGALSYSSGGNGSPAHVMGEYFKQLTGTFILHVPYRGPLAALQDLIGGRSDMMFASVAAAVPHVKSGRLRAFAVTSAEPLAALPDVPTFAKAGYPKFDVRDWAGIVAPTSLPASAVVPLNAEIVKALGEPEVVERFAQMGTYLQTSTPQAFGALIRAEIPKWADVVKRSSIKLD